MIIGGGKSGLHKREDTSEMLGAVRLRKVQQKTVRYFIRDREGENLNFES